MSSSWKLFDERREAEPDLGPSMALEINSLGLLDSWQDQDMRLRDGPAQVLAPMVRSDRQAQDPVVPLLVDQPIIDDYSSQESIPSMMLTNMPGFGPNTQRRAQPPFLPRPMPGNGALAVVNPPAKVGSSDIDRVMLYVQAISRNKGKVNAKEIGRVLPPPGEVNGGIERKTTQTLKYPCTFTGCPKSFSQKSHLETHYRSHTGERPFQCPFEGCYKRFSQMGNLRTHTRGHTGERPFECEKCSRRFAQRGSLNNHMQIHVGAKRLMCRVDSCNKTFSQLGNLKVHHNTAHKTALQEFTRRLRDGDLGALSPKDRELFDYFFDLYRNANKGISGRGKGTRTIAKQDMPQTLAMPVQLPRVTPGGTQPSIELRPMEIPPQPLPLNELPSQASSASWQSDKFAEEPRQPQTQRPQTTQFPSLTNPQPRGFTPAVLHPSMNTITTNNGWPLSKFSSNQREAPDESANEPPSAATLLSLPQDTAASDWLPRVPLTLSPLGPSSSSSSRMPLPVLKQKFPEIGAAPLTDPGITQTNRLI